MWSFQDKGLEGLGQCLVGSSHVTVVGSSHVIVVGSSHVIVGSSHVIVVGSSHVTMGRAALVGPYPLPSTC